MHCRPAETWCRRPVWGRACPVPLVRWHLPRGLHLPRAPGRQALLGQLCDLPLEETGKPGSSPEALERPKFSAMGVTGRSRLGCGTGAKLNETKRGACELARRWDGQQSGNRPLPGATSPGAMGAQAPAPPGSAHWYTCSPVLLTARKVSQIQTPPLT